MKPNLNGDVFARLRPQVDTAYDDELHVLRDTWREVHCVGGARVGDTVRHAQEPDTTVGIVRGSNADGKIEVIWSSPPTVLTWYGRVGIDQIRSTTAPYDIIDGKITFEVKLTPVVPLDYIKIDVKI